jgi:BMFP domain-containing protein YqiC|tara:strand:- start:669 stop:965 length:297 start_codon:yes stop_codon:yes gene_type:complete
LQTRAKIFDDIAKVTGGAVSTLSGIKTELENLVRQQIERILVDADMVPREEFEVVKAMASKARSKQEEMEKRILQLEKITKLSVPKKTKKRSRSKAKE